VGAETGLETSPAALSPGQGLMAPEGVQWGPEPWAGQGEAAGGWAGIVTAGGALGALADFYWMVT